MRKVYYDLLYLSSCGVNRIAPSEACLTAYQSNQEALQKLYRFSRAHFLDALIGMTLQRAGVTLPVKWCEDIAKAVRKTILLDAERTKILLFMERNGIWYLPLKGILLKDYYPSVGMRRISDNDILFDEAYADKLAQYMVSQGYTPLFVPNSNHDIYRKEPVYNFEMHRALYAASNRNNWADYYRDIKARLLPEPGTSYGYRMKNEDFYIYLVSHA